MTAIKPTRLEDYNQWYQQLIVAAELAEHAPVRGCMVIKPWGYAIWERIQSYLDRRFKETGHLNAYFPLLIPLSYLEKEAAHVAGFAKECAVVTHRQLRTDENNRLIPAEELEEPLVVRPTSEAIIGEIYAKWVNSYRDLPILLNQWANVVRWEKRTRLFLRTSEFLWQEGHTVHATREEAVEETVQMLEIYRQLAEDVLAIPVLVGEKPIGERFPGAVNTYCIEGMMQDRKALQLGTSHFLGQNFASAADIKFTDQHGQISTAWTTSWGVSTRLIGGLIMTHGDDNGLVLPPIVAPYQIVIVPVYKEGQADQDVILAQSKRLQQILQNQDFAGEKLRVHVDNRQIRLGDKNWQWIKKGVPLIMALGSKDLEKGSISITRRDDESLKPHFIKLEQCAEQSVAWLSEIQNQLLVKAKKYRDAHTVRLHSREEFVEFFSDAEDHHAKGFACCYLSNEADIEQYLKPFKVSARCILADAAPGQCIFTGKAEAPLMVCAKAY